MINLTISGDTPEEFYKDFAKTAALVFRAASKAPPVDTGEPRDGVVRAAAPLTDSDKEKLKAHAPVAEPVDDVTKLPVDEPVVPKKTRAKKAVEVIDATATEVKPTPAIPEGGDEIPDFLDRRVDKPTAAPVYELKDCRTRVTEVFAAFERRAREKIPGYAAIKGEALDKIEKKIMHDKVEYTKPLIFGFGVQKVGDLKPEQFGEFMAKSEAYLAGTA